MRPIDGEGEGDERGRDEADAEARERELWDGIEALGAPRERGGELRSAELIARVLAQAGDGRAAHLPASVPAGVRRRRGVVAALVAVAAAAALAVTLGEHGDLFELADRDDEAPVVAEAPPDRPLPAAPLALPPASEAAPGPPTTGGVEVAPTSPESLGGPPNPSVALGGGPSSPPDVGRLHPAGAAGPTADELLRRAQSLLQGGRTVEAMDAYRDLLARRPGSGEARTALVSLGQLSLDQGRAEEALGYLDRYVAGRGPLDEEASYLRIAALRRLGRAAEATAAIAEFLGRYPESVHAERLRHAGGMGAPPMLTGGGEPGR